MNNYPPNDPNDPHSQPTMAGPYPQWTQPGQPSYPQWGQQAPPPPQFPQSPGQYPQSGQNFPQYPPQPPQQSGQFGPPPTQQRPPKPPWWDTNARKEYYKQYPPTKKQQLGIGCAALIGVIMVCSLCNAIASTGKTEQQSAQEASVPTKSTPVHHVILATMQAMVTPTVIPTPIPTPEPTQPPMQQQKPAQQLFVTFTGESAAVGDATSYVAVHTLPGAALTISVEYCSGHTANSEGLKGTQYADASGDNIWTWDPKTTCRGTATAYVTASLNGQTASNSTTFTVS